MLWAIFHVLPTKLKFQWVILSKFNIAILCCQWAIFLLNETMTHGPTVSQSLHVQYTCSTYNTPKSPHMYYRCDTTSHV